MKRPTLLAMLVVFFLILALSSAPTATAQNSSTGGIAGTVQDNTPAIIPGAAINVTNATGQSRTETANEKGEYQILGLAPGTYKVSVSVPGFKDFEAASVTVTAGQTARVDATLVPTGVSTSISVQGQAAAQVETESSQVSGEITATEIVTLGLNGRNFTQLATLAPGVSNQSGQDEALVGVKGSVKYSVNGGRVEYNTYEVDGGDILNASINGSSSALIVYPSIDAIADMQVLTSNYGAMYGRSASGTIQATTKAGGNAFHGDAYFYLRNNHLNARNFFDPATGPAPLYQKYDQGGTIGGPLYIPGHYNTNKDKTFFFFSEEYHHDREPQNFNEAVPSMQERDCSQAHDSAYKATGGVNPYCGHGLGSPGVPSFGITDFSSYGDFSDVCPAVGGGSAGFSPGSTATFTRAAYPDCPGNPAGGNNFTGFPGNLVPIDPISGAILGANLIPEPNSRTGCNSSLVLAGKSTPGWCYVATLSPLTTWREDLFRIDHNITPKQKIYFRYIHDAWSTVSVTPQWGYVQEISPSIKISPTVQNQFVGPGLSMVTHWTSTIGNAFVNDVAMSYSSDHISLTDIPGLNANLKRPSSFSNPVCVQDNNVDDPSSPCGMGSIFAADPKNPFGGKLPSIVIAGTNSAYGGTGFAADPSYMPWHHSNPTYNFREDATWAHGKHTISFGVQFIIAQRNEVNPPVGSNSGAVQGIATFTNLNNRNTSGNAFADFLGSLGSTQRNSAGKLEQLPGPAAIQAFQQDSGQGVYHNNYKTVEPYVQDDWKVTSHLTLNLGLRISLFGLYHEKYNNSYNWVPSQFSAALANEVTVAPDIGTLLLRSNGTPVPINLTNLDPHLVNGIQQCGVNGVPSSCMTNHLVNPAPRVGFAWDPTGKGKTSIRAGYGIFYEHGTGNEANTGSLEGSPGTTGVLDMTQFYPTSWGCIGNPAGSGCTPAGPGAFPLNVTAIPTKVVWPYVQQWSLGVQQQLPWKLLGSVGYVGSRGTNLAAELQINQLVPVNASQNPFAPGQALTTDICSGFSQATFTVNGQSITQGQPGYVNLLAACTGVVSQIPTPNALRTGDYSPAPPAIGPGLGQIYSLQNIASSKYDALQVTLRRDAGPLTLGVSYSYSHSFDDSSDRTSAAFINAYNIQENRASSDFDQRHLLNINYVYDVPLLKILNATRILKVFNALGPWQKPDDDLSSWHKKYFEGWQISGITIFATGTPFTVLNGGSPNGVSSLDNAGVAAVIGPGSYPDIVLGAQQPAAVANPNLIGPLLGNPAQFVAPQGLTYGNAGRNYLNNPSQFNFDLTFVKNFKIRESKTLQFRVETYNTFNHTQFRIYDPANSGNTGNNVINCYGGTNNSAGDSSCVASSSFLHPVDAHRPRTIQLAVKFLF